MPTQTPSNHKNKERAPWYIVIGRIIQWLMITVFFFSLFLGAPFAILRAIEKANSAVQITPWILATVEAHPIAAIIILILGFIFMMFWIAFQFVDALTAQVKKGA